MQHTVGEWGSRWGLGKDKGDASLSLNPGRTLECNGTRKLSPPEARAHGPRSSRNGKQTDLVPLAAHPVMCTRVSRESC